MERVFVSGGAGFIGSNLTDRLLSSGYYVTVYDNFSTGCRLFLDNADGHPNFRLISGDMLDYDTLCDAVSGHDFVFHLSANADVRFGTQHPRRDLDQNTIATFNMLEAMRINNIKQIAFASTGSVYGESGVIPTPEDAPFPVQTSLYGASKLAGEGLIAAYTEGFDFRGYIFRFVSVLGERYTHGHIFDFYRMLKENPHHLPVLGNGRQRKSYIYVQDCIDAMLVAIDRSDDKINIFNLGVDDYVEVKESISVIIDKLNISPDIIYSDEDRGWIGDNPFIYLSTARILSLGWRPKLSIQEGIQRTLQWLMENEWVYEVRQ
jgi:UDP-glucose 4-epimerase